MVANALQRPALVLNRNWQAVNVATVGRAMIMLWNDAARVVDPLDYQTYAWSDWAELRPGAGEAFIQSVRQRLRVPEVIVLAEYNRLPTGAVSFSRRNLFKRDHWACQYCGVQPSGDELTIDHVVPRSRGGTSTWENCVLACVECNKRKADRSPREARMKLRKTPIRPKWQPFYAREGQQMESWSKFVSEAYWNVELVK